MSNNLRPARAVPPGKILSRELEARGWTQKDLAEIMGRPYQAVNEIIKGTKQITPETAIELSEAFGTSSDLWMNLESKYRLNMAERDKENKNIALKSRIYSLAPIRELIKRGWIRRSRRIQDLNENLCKFLGIQSINSEPQFAGVTFRRSIGRNKEHLSPSQFAWIARVKFLAEQQSVSKFSHHSLRLLIDDLLNLTGHESKLVKVPARILAAGIRFVIVPHLPGTYLDGATWIIKNNPTVALTLRYDRIDSFWFTLLHELAHIYLKHSGMFLDRLFDGDVQENGAMEDSANDLARAWLVKPAQLNNFVKTNRLYYSRSAVESFAARLKRHPGIVVGQMHYADLMDYSYLRKYLVKVSPFLSNWIDSPGLTKVSS